MGISRRDCLRGGLAAGGSALLAAGSLALPAEADEEKGGEETLYGHGMVWNRALPGIAGELRLSFDLYADLGAGTGIGTAADPDHPDWNIHFAISSLQTEKRPKGETRYIMSGVVTEATNRDNVGQSVRIVAETAGEATAIAIGLGHLAFTGAGLVYKQINIPLILILIILRL